VSLHTAWGARAQGDGPASAPRQSALAKKKTLNGCPKKSPKKKVRKKKKKRSKEKSNIKPEKTIKKKKS
jgi:hypothetical protein